MKITTPFNKKFIEKFEIVLFEYLYYNTYNRFHIVPSFLELRTTLSYLPVLSYTDIEYKDIENIVKDTKDFKYIIKVLNPQYKDFKKDDMVTMRVDISSHSFEEIMQNHIKARTRNYIKQSQQENLIVKRGNDNSIINDFYKLYSHSMHKLGSPAHSIKMFQSFAKHFEDDVTFFICYKENKPIYATSILYDENIAWSGWVGRDNSYSSSKAGYLLFAEAMKFASQEKKKDIFDFGRSGYQSGTYSFKSKFGAIPVKIDIFSHINNRANLYSKYKLASAIWKYIPFKLADKLGNILVRYLPEY